MRDYELIFIVHPDLDESAFNDIVARIQGWISGAGGEIVKVDLWGKRKLAYPISKQTEGQYVLIESKMEPSENAELERNLGLLEPVMRYLIALK
jgi:small subunit ribosomal protein S6